MSESSAIQVKATPTFARNLRSLSKKYRSVQADVKLANRIQPSRSRKNKDEKLLPHPFKRLTQFAFPGIVRSFVALQRER